jgi:hypothetical protein
MMKVLRHSFRCVACRLRASPTGLPLRYESSDESDKTKASLGVGLVRVGGLNDTNSGWQ